MTNAELIKALRYCGNFEDREGCDEECSYFYDKDCPNRIMCDAADAIERLAAEVEQLKTAWKTVNKLYEEMKRNEQQKA